MIKIAKIFAAGALTRVGSDGLAPRDMTVPDDRSFTQISGIGRVGRYDFLAAVVTASEYAAG